MTEQRDPVASLVGDVIVVRLDVGARVLVRALRAAREHARLNGRPFSAEYQDLLVIAELAEAKATARGSAFGTTAVPMLGDLVPPRPQSTYDRSPPLCVSRVARLVGVSERAVRKAASTGRLAGQIRSGRWEFTAAAVHEWNGRRRRR